MGESLFWFGVFVAGFLLGYWTRSLKRPEPHQSGLYFSDRALRGDRSLRDLNKKP